MAALLAAALLASCGGGEPDATGARPSDGTTTTDATADNSEQIRPNVRTGPLRITGRGVKQFRDIAHFSLLRFAKEASRSELERAARVVHEYLVARVKYDWSTACSYLDEDALKEVEMLGSHFKKTAGKGCPVIAPFLLGKVPARKTFVSSEVKAGALRVKGDGTAKGNGSYFFYRAGGDPYTTTLSREEDGSWKLSSLFTEPISPPPS